MMRRSTTGAELMTISIRAGARGADIFPRKGEAVVPASQLATAMKEIRELQRLLGKKAQEAKILKEAVDNGLSKNVWSALVLQAGTDERSSLRKCIRPLASQPLLAARP